VSIQSFRDCAPHLPKIFLAVLGEKRREGGFLQKRAALVVRVDELVDLPLYVCRVREMGNGKRTNKRGECQVEEKMRAALPAQKIASVNLRWLYMRVR
jgi:hypothetical protein